MSELSLKHSPRLVFLILVLCAMVAPISIDLFSPSLPAIGQSFGVGSELAQWTVSGFMLGFSLSLLICGPLADRYGARNVLLVGYSVYLVATALILVVGDIHWMIAARVLQALFGGFGTALSRSVVRELYSGKQEVAMIAAIGACMSVAPAVAPIVGGIIDTYLGWQASFVVMSAIAIIALVGVYFLVPASTKEPVSLSPASLLQSYASVMGNYRYMFYTVAAALAFAGGFAFIAGGPFVLIEQMGLSSTQFGVCFAFMIGAYIVSTTIFSKINQRRTPEQWMNIGLLLALVGAGSSVGAAAVLDSPLIPYMAGMVVYEIGLGILLPAAQVLALRHIDKHSGTAAGLIFFLEILIAVPISYLAGLIPHTTLLPLGLLTLGCIGMVALLKVVGRMTLREEAPQLSS